MAVTDSGPRRYDTMWTSIPRLAQTAARRFGPDPALVDGGRRWTFGELAAEARAATAAAIAAGIGPGDRVAVWAPNSAEWIFAALGAQGAGAAVVPVNTRFRGHEAAHVLRTSEARVLFTVNGFLGIDFETVLRENGEALPHLERIVVLAGPPAHPATVTWSNHVAAGQGVAASEVEARIDAVAAEDIADIIFTSGTTGRPKGVLTTHGQNLRAFGVYTEAIGLQHGDRYLIVNPFFHAFGYKAGWLACLMRGATIVPLPAFDGDAVLRTISEHRITVLPGPPTLLHSILEHPDRHDHDLSSLRLTVTGAAAVPVELIRRLRDERIFEVILTAYGLTESSGLVSVSRPEDPPEIISRWSGEVIADVEVQVVDDQGRSVPTGEPGEILVRGFNVMQGYVGDPDATAAAVDPDGWLHTGDIGVQDDVGRLRITDRKTDMFIVGGFNAYPAEIEDLLLACDRVGQVAVVGMPDARMGEVGAAFVVARHGAAIEPDEVIAWARAHMANYKVPRLVEVVDELPVNAGGKVDKARLRDRARQTPHNHRRR